jgi:hypothetical protein
MESNYKGDGIWVGGVIIITIGSLLAGILQNIGYLEDLCTQREILGLHIRYVL